MGNLNREVPSGNHQSGMSSLRQTNGLVPTSPQKSPTPLTSAPFALPSRRPGLVQHPSFPTAFNNHNNKLSSSLSADSHEIIYYELDDSSDCSTSTGSPEMIRRNSSSTSQHHHRKVARSQSEPKAPNNLFMEFSPSNNAGPYLGQPQLQNRFKTELCRSFQENGSCKYGEKCQFAHGEQELRNVQRHAKYKTERCVNFHATGLCAYGRRCHFIHHPDEENQRRSSVGIPEDNVSTSPTGHTGSVPAAQSPARGRTVSLSSFPQAITIPVMQNFIADQSLNLGSCGNSRSALSSCSYSSSPLSMSPGIGVWHERDPFGSSSSSEGFHGSDEESNEAPGPWKSAVENLLSAIDY